MASTKLDQTVARLGGETTVRGVLATTCRELVELLDATACAVSRVIGDLLVGLDEYTLSARPLEHGHEFLISDYPSRRRWSSRVSHGACRGSIPRPSPRRPRCSRSSVSSRC